MTQRTEQLLKAMEAFSPFNRFLGIRGESVSPGRAVMALPVRPEFVGDPRRPALHGGVISALIDTAGGSAAWSALRSFRTPGEFLEYLQQRRPRVFRAIRTHIPPGLTPPDNPRTGSAPGPGRASP